MPDDRQLLEAYSRRGDLESLSALVVAHSTRLLALLRGLLPSKEDAEDALQETWMRVIRSCGSYRGGSVRAYLACIARSVAVDRLRRSDAPAVRLDEEDEDGGTAADWLEAAGPTPDRAFETRATAADVRIAIRALPMRQREVLLLRIEAELTFQEIADELGIPLGTALTRMREATERLRKTLGGMR